MNFRYGYFYINESLSYVWEQSRSYWSSQKKITIISKSSFSTKTFAKMHLSRKGTFTQSEEYYLRFVKDSHNPNTTHVRVSFEFIGDSLTGATGRMKRTINNWINALNLPSIQFTRKPIKEYEVFFSKLMEEEKKERKIQFCPHCGQKLEEAQKFCHICGSELI